MDTTLYDGVITDALQLLRLSAGEQTRMIKLLKEMEADLRAQLREGGQAPRRMADIKRLLGQARRTIDEYYRRAQEQLDLEAVAAISAQRVSKSLKKAALIVKMGVELPPEHVLKALAQEALILGQPARAWWARQADDLAFQYGAQVRQGILQGETTERIVARIFGQPGKGIPGIMDLSRRNAASLVQTSLSSVANSARQATFEANGDLVKGTRWVTALDSRVCLRCAAMADKVWDLEGKPIGHSVHLFSRPPIHYRDRCVLVPVLKSFQEMGIDLPEFDGGTRASTTGQQAAGTTLEGYLQRNPSVAEDILGPGRMRLWKAGKINLGDLVSGTGRDLTIDQLRAL